MLPSELWTLDLSHLDLVLSSLSYIGICYSEDLRSLFGHALLVLAEWSKPKIELVQEQKTI